MKNSKLIIGAFLILFLAASSLVFFHLASAANSCDEGTGELSGASAGGSTTTKFGTADLTFEKCKPYTYSIDWGDGNSVNNTSGVSPVSKTHGYAADGNYTVKMCGVDRCFSQDITIGNGAGGFSCPNLDYPITACNDGIDNDGNGKKDYCGIPQDDNCDSYGDTYEGSSTPYAELYIEANRNDFQLSISAPHNGIAGQLVGGISVTPFTSGGVQWYRYKIDDAYTNRPYGYGDYTLTVSDPDNVGYQVTEPWNNPSIYYGGQSCSVAGSGLSHCMVWRVEYNAATPTVDLKCDGGNGPCTVNQNASSTLSWTSTNADSCSASGGWNGALATSGSQSSGPVNATTTFTIQCVKSGVTATDDVVVQTVPNVAPSVTSVTATTPADYCSISSLDTISWTYNDTNNVPVNTDPQTAFQVQVKQGASISYDTGKVLGAGTQLAIPRGVLPWNNIVTAQARVWDSSDTASPWQTMTACNGPACNGSTNWHTPKHSYPSIAFTWTPTKPQLGKAAAFDGTSSLCYADNNTSSSSAICNTWKWTWGDGSVNNNSTPNKSHTYQVVGSKNVILQVSDPDYTCSTTQTINIQVPLPDWKEVLPK